MPRQRTDAQNERYRAYHRDYYNNYTKLGLVKGTKACGRKKLAEVTDEMRKEIHELWAENPTLDKYDLQEKFGINLMQAKHILVNMPIFVVVTDSS